MKKSIFFITFLFLITSFQLFSKPRDISEAKKIAEVFLLNKNTALKRSPKLDSKLEIKLDLAYLNESDALRSEVDKKPYYYVFNTNDNNGFIIISGNDNAKKVLGYSDNGTFDINNLPQGFEYWLSFYQEEIEYLYSLEETENIIADDLYYYTENTFPQAITPLVQTKWNQDYPYNMFCPIVPDSTGKRAVSGCVATAAAQIMHYYGWPEKGDSSKTYTTRTYKIELSVDYSDTYYDWSNMANIYNSKSTLKENEAVGTLMYHVGTAVNMNYGHTSGAYTRDMAQALATYFNYDKNIRYIQRTYYSFSEWKNIIKTELAEGRPILYAGSSSSGAHMFVCDGYNSDDFFHINWGWGGSSDGYFELTALTPGTQGIGGTTGGYNRSQELIIGIQKPIEEQREPFYEISMKKAPEVSVDRINRTDTFRITALSLYNRGSNLFSGKFGVALYADNELKNILIEKEVNSLKANYGWGSYNIDTSIEGDVLNGYYKLYVVYKGVDQSDWNIVRGAGGIDNYVNVIVTNKQIYFSEAIDANPSLIVKNCEAIGRYYADRVARLRVNIANEGAEYNSYLFFALESKGNGEMFFLSPSEVFFLPEGEEKDMIFELVLNKIESGNYRLHILEDYYNNFSSDNRRFILKEPLEIEIYEEPTESYSLELTSQISVPNPQYVHADNIKVTANIKNGGGYFAGYMAVYLLKQGSSQTSDRFGYQRVYIDENEELIIDFTGSLEVENGNYTVWLLYLDEEKNSWEYLTPRSYTSLSIRITDEEPPVVKLDLNSVVNISIYPNPTDDILYIQSTENISSIFIYDVSGNKHIERFYEGDKNIELSLNNLEKGIYIIKVLSQNGIVTTSRIVRR